MPRAAIAYCGYAEVLAHLRSKDVYELGQYNSTVGKDYPLLHIAEKAWVKRRKELSSAIRDR